MKTIIITVDFGHFKAYQVTEGTGKSPKIELMESYDSLEGHSKLGAKLSDIAGRFTGGGGKGEVAKGYGEPHRLKADIDRKLVKVITTDINKLIKKEDCDNWHLAAGEKINKEIIKKLDPKVKSKLHKNITADLTNIPKSKILGYFK
jgi:hypothetical protein